jgi:group II intron reverse transcriptase/maturase
VTSRSRSAHPTGTPVSSAEGYFTLDALRRAWLAVKQAGGGAGVDGVTLAQFGARLEVQLAALQHELASGAYRPQPARQVLVPKRSGGLRPLAIWALRDRIAQRAVYDIIAPPFEAEFLPCSFGFRPGRSVEAAIRQLADCRDQHRQWVVNADIKSCFDEIDSRRLLPLVRRHVRDPTLLHYIDGWVQHRILNSADGVPRQAGASQGSVLSPLLANIYLHPFDQAMTAKGLMLLRYADNFVICCRRKTEAVAAMQTAQASLQTLGLRLNDAKSTVVSFQAGFSWLGYFFIRQECYRI